MELNAQNMTCNAMFLKAFNCRAAFWNGSPATSRPTLLNQDCAQRDNVKPKGANAHLRDTRGRRETSNICDNQQNLRLRLLSAWVLSFWHLWFFKSRVPQECNQHWIDQKFSESGSTGVWCVPGFGAGFEIALEPSELRKEGENPRKGHFKFCAKPWYAPNPGSKEIWRIPRRGVREGGVAQICRKLRAKFAQNLPVFRFAHQRKGAQNCRKLVANLKVKFGQFCANTSFPMPPLLKFLNGAAGAPFLRGTRALARTRPSSTIYVSAIYVRISSASYSSAPCCWSWLEALSPLWRPGWGGGPKMEGGVKILSFQSPRLTPFYRDSIENRQARGQKSTSSSSPPPGLRPLPRQSLSWEIVLEN